ncbi:MAG: FAD-binding oxidoreductase [Gammaproteobacteria bacterium]|nr:FAD-binding oxidoreductase [Gammaproteobacteria bacterium]TVQ48615.1 MAG: FAD-binding oxidoreductase [Gammaproteobacteria bacterium]
MAGSHPAPAAATTPDLAEGLLEALEDLLGAEHLLTGEADCRFYATDIYRASPLVFAAVARPGSVDALQALVALCARHRAPMVVRGGGASYTDAYLPTRPGSVCIDTSRLQGIEINAEDMYVTVEAGVTWAALHEALAHHGLRTPFWGPFSGIAATVAGGMSHYAVNYGSGTYGVSAESLVQMDVILANGELIRTGSAGAVGSLPHFRFYGPDLAGLFIGDAGAFGVKARLTLRLVPQPRGFAAVSFGFPDGERCLTAMTAAARLGVVAQNFAMDPRQQKGALDRMASANTWEAARSVFRSARHPLDGLLQVARLAAGGRNFLRGASYSAHFSTEGASIAEAREKLAVLRRVLRPHGAEVAASIPTYFNANPFLPLTPILGPNGERWKPTHAILPLSRVLQHHADVEALVAEYAPQMAEHRVRLTRMLMFVSTHAFVYEPTFLWEDELLAYHERVYPAALLPTVPRHPPNPGGRALVAEMKDRLQALCIANGASHLQVGKDYPYLATREPALAAFVRQLKDRVDPDGLLNPGALGLHPDAGG